MPGVMWVDYIRGRRFTRHLVTCSSTYGGRRERHNGTRLSCLANGLGSGALPAPPGCVLKSRFKHTPHVPSMRSALTQSTRRPRPAPGTTGRARSPAPVFAWRESGAWLTVCTWSNAPPHRAESRCARVTADCQRVGTDYRRTCRAVPTVVHLFRVWSAGWSLVSSGACGRDAGGFAKGRLNEAERGSVLCMGCTNGPRALWATQQGASAPTVRQRADCGVRQQRRPGTRAHQVVGAQELLGTGKGHLYKRLAWGQKWQQRVVVCDPGQGERGGGRQRDCDTGKWRWPGVAVAMPRGQGSDQWQSGATEPGRRRGLSGQGREEAASATGPALWQRAFGARGIAGSPAPVGSISWLACACMLFEHESLGTWAAPDALLRPHRIGRRDRYQRAGRANGSESCDDWARECKK